jgi:hypothetical protein
MTAEAASMLMRRNIERLRQLRDLHVVTVAPPVWQLERASRNGRGNGAGNGHGGDTTGSPDPGIRDEQPSVVLLAAPPQALLLAEPRAPAAGPQSDAPVGEPAEAAPVTVEDEAPAAAVEPGRCTAIRVDGRPCEAAAVHGRDVCIGHGVWARPSRASRAVTAPAVQRAVPPRLRSAVTRLERALFDVLDGKLDPERAHAAAALGGALVQLVEAGILERRLGELEARLGGPEFDADQI